MTTRKIITNNKAVPSIWVAHYEGDEEHGAEFGPRGFGVTAQEAIADLMANFPDDSAETA